MKTRKDALEGKALPADFRLSPTRGRSGARSAWGGEIGGVKINDHALAMKPLTTEKPDSKDISRVDSASTTVSLNSSSFEIRYCVFINRYLRYTITGSKDIKTVTLLF